MNASLNDDFANLAKSLLGIRKLVYSPTELKSPERSSIIQELKNFIATSNGDDQPETMRFNDESPSDSIPHLLQRLNNDFDFKSPKSDSSNEGDQTIYSLFDETPAIVSPALISDKQTRNPPTPSPPLPLSHRPKDALKGLASKNNSLRRRVPCPNCSAKPCKSHLKFHMYAAHGGPGQYRRQRSDGHDGSTPTRKINTPKQLAELAVSSVVRSVNRPIKDDRFIRCNYCSANMYYCSYTSHLRQVHNNQGLQYQCKSCHSRFSSNMSLERHTARRWECAKFYTSSKSSKRRPANNALMTSSSGGLMKSSINALIMPSNNASMTSSNSASMTSSISASMTSTIETSMTSFADATMMSSDKTSITSATKTPTMSSNNASMTSSIISSMTSSNDTPFQCSLCDQRFRTARGRLVHHWHRHTPKKLL